jgi:cell division protein FtsB
MQELIKILLPVLIAIGYVRGRLNGLVAKVDSFERRVEKMEDRYAECPARIEAEAE